MKTLLLFLVLTSCVVAVTSGGICRENCAVHHETVGCYRDNQQRVLPNYIYNERDSSIKNYGGRKIDWGNWDNYLPGLICRCAKKAKELGYDLFGIQFYGECWAGNSGQHKPKSLGEVDSCIGDLFKKCGRFDRFCAGSKWTNMVYKIVDTTCADAPFEKVGCFKDRHKEGRRPLPRYILNDRDVKHKHFSGKRIDWRNWDTYVPDLACRCAKKAKENGWKVFGLQFYGECWSGEDGENTNFIDGKSSKCTDKCSRPCHPGSEFCVGQHFTNFVYRLKGPCEVEITPVGCYNEQKNGRALSHEIYNENDPRSKVFGGKIINQNKWIEEFPDFLCKCARNAKAENHEYFGVQNSGECWSDENSPGRFDMYGQSNQCSEGDEAKPCDPNEKLCAGTGLNNFVYKVTLPGVSSDVPIEINADVPEYPRWPLES